MSSAYPFSRRKDFEKEMLPHLTAVYNFAMRMIGDSDDAKDLVQETYIRAYKYFDKYTPGTNAMGWLSRIMKNLYFNQYKKKAASPETIYYDEIENFYLDIKSSVADETDVQEKLFDGLLEDEVEEALLGIPDEYRMVVILCDIEECSYEEVARISEIPIGTVRSRLHRGRKILRGKLREYAMKRGFKYADEKADKNLDIAR